MTKTNKNTEEFIKALRENRKEDAKKFLKAAMIDRARKYIKSVNEEK